MVKGLCASKAENATIQMLKFLSRADHPQGLAWNGHAVFVTGRPGAPQTVALPTATPADIAHP
ncbi:hypothetical protein BS329_39335 [Amycolatopsis coloradensis]|uniref:Uncharacterized protein n=1 Tax=Amycolatopsis coloradensis TaxID=76021 RepID=A0A1R0KE88_9PSEU|nr:hypothetical protein BS329_39335 [Amycolatopsis coloradensis]